MSIETIPPAKPYFSSADKEEIKRSVDQILTSGRLTLGDYTLNFEERFAQVTKVRHAIAVNSGTSALEIVLRALNVKWGDEVVVPTNTFGATAAAVILAGGRPVMADINADSLTIDSKNLKSKISKKTKGVIAVHIGGLVCPEIEEIKELCKKKDLFLIEDAAHAHGSMIEGKPAGSIGSAGCFSFYPTKVLTSGEGGMVTTNDEEIAKSARIMRDQGKETFSSSVIVKIGYNWRMPEICAAIGLVQLKHLNEFIERRNQIAKVYDEKLDACGIEFVKTPRDHVNNYYKYTFFLPKELDRSNFKNRCREKGVLYGGEVYWPPLHLQPAFRDYVSNDSLFRVADDRCARMVNPPIFSQMTINQANRVCEVTRNIISELTG